MSQIIQAIYENGILRPLGHLELEERQHVRVTVDLVPQGETESVPGESSDPLEGIRVSTGIADLAEHFDDYRFGLRKP
jgi:predicted DNA-binding antitoxin AbrB/MazE fold protein